MVVDLVPGWAGIAGLAASSCNWVQLALATPVVLWGGWPFFVRGWTLGRQPQPEHVHADRAGRGRWRTSTAWWRRSRRASSRPRCAWRAARSPVYFEAAAVITTLVLLGQVLELRARSRTSGGDPGAAGPGAQTTARHRPRGRDGRGRPAGAGAAGRPPARAARREGAGGRRGARGPQQRGRVDDHRRADPGREAAGRRGDRRHGQRDRQLRHAGRARRARHAAGADRADGRARPSAAAPRSSGWPTWWPATSCRPWCWSRSSRSSSGRLVGPPAARWRMRSSTPWRC